MGENRMRTIGLSLAITLLASPLFAQGPTGGAAGQPPAQQPAATPPAARLDPTRNKLDALLLNWEQQMRKVETIVAEVQRIETNKISGFTDTYVGSAKLMRPGYAALEMKKTTNPQIYEKYIATGNFLYEFNSIEKVVRVHEMPANPNGPADDNFLSFLFGPKAQMVKERYDLTLVKEDQWYYYLEIVPRLAADKAEFAKARMVLFVQGFLPRQLWFEHPNGNEVKWDFPRVQANVPLDKREFTAPQIPADWKVQRMQAQPQPQGQPQPQSQGQPQGQPQPQPQPQRP
jgi:TIGR03009 family protein